MTEYAPNHSDFLDGLRKQAQERSDQRKAYLSRDDGLAHLRDRIYGDLRRIPDVGYMGGPLLVKAIEDLIDAKLEAFADRIQEATGIRP